MKTYCQSSLSTRRREERDGLGVGLSVGEDCKEEKVSLCGEKGRVGGRSDGGGGWTGTQG